VEQNRLVAALSYLGLLFLIPLLLKRESPFAQFHGRQGLFMALVFSLGALVFWIPLLGWAAFAAALAADLYALVQALRGRAWPIPGAEEVLQKLNL
jgi:uncharacterized membrane protein